MGEYSNSSPELPASFDSTPHVSGLDRLQIRSGSATAEIFYQGAHLTRFKPADAAHEVLFTSAESLYRAGTPIRGGVPVIFPWFGPHPDRSDLPQHGLVRTRPWRLESATKSETGVVRTEWCITDDEETRSAWPHAFRLRLTVETSDFLHMVLEVENRSQETFYFEEALHTYLHVSDVREIRVRGLVDTEYLDKLAAMERKKEVSERIAIEAETDRIYLNTAATCWVDDPGFQRTLEVAKTGSNTTVLWNPWVGKAAALPDFGNEEWPRMVCIETTNAAENAVRLPPGAAHQMSISVRVHPLHGS